MRSFSSSLPKLRLSPEERLPKFLVQVSLYILEKADSSRYRELVLMSKTMGVMPLICVRISKDLSTSATVNDRLEDLNFLLRPQLSTPNPFLRLVPSYAAAWWNPDNSMVKLLGRLKFWL